MKLCVQTFLTFDGVMQAPGGPDEDRDGDFAYGGWLSPFWSEQAGAVVDESLERLDALLLGRRTYEIFAGFWPQVDDTDAVAARFRRVPKYVVSTTLRDPEWSGSEVVSGDVVSGIGELKQRPGQELQVHGSATLIQTLLAHDLVDELAIFRAPVVLAGGKRLFGSGTRPATYEIAGHRVLPNGVTFTRLRRGGPVQTSNIVDG